MELETGRAMKRVAITGLGSINALGAGVRAFAAGLRAGRCAIGEVTLFPTDGYRSRMGAQVGEIPVPAGLPRTLVRRASRTGLLALVAAWEAWGMAGLPAPSAAEAGVVLGTTTGGMSLGEEALSRLVAADGRRDRLSDWLETPVFAPTDMLAAAFAPRGPRLTVSTACSSGANAMGIAADWIRAGRVKAVLCGASDSLCRMTFSGFNALQALDQRPCRPFDRGRAGLSLGEGAALFILEERQQALRRGARILAEFVACGASADAHHLTQPRSDGAGAVLAMRRALQLGGVAPESIDYINAHGTGTSLNDVAETRAVKVVFGAAASRIPVSSTKSMVGHCLGAAGAIEALTSVIAMREGFVPPTATLESPDPECDLDYVPGASRAASLRTVLSNSYGFGGNNTSILLRAADD